MTSQLKHKMKEIGYVKATIIIVLCVLLFFLVSFLTIEIITPFLNPNFMYDLQNTAEDKCERSGGYYDFTGFGGEHFCYIDNIQHSMYKTNKGWMIAE